MMHAMAFSIALAVVSQQASMGPLYGVIRDGTATPRGWENLDVPGRILGDSLQADEADFGDVTVAGADITSISATQIVVQEIRDPSGRILGVWVKPVEPRYVASGEDSLWIDLIRGDMKLYIAHLRVGSRDYMPEDGRVYAPHNKGFSLIRGDRLGTHRAVNLEVYPAWTRDEPIHFEYFLVPYEGPESYNVRFWPCLPMALQNQDSNDRRKVRFPRLLLAKKMGKL